VGQFIGVVCATSLAAASAGAAAVVVRYEECSISGCSSSASQALSVAEAKAHGQVHQEHDVIPFSGTFLASGSRTASGEMSTTGQKHFYMETQATFGVPDGSGGLLVNTSTQMLGGGALNGAQSMLAKTLNLPESKITVQTGAVGGAFGGKVFHYAPVAAAASVAALELKRPVLLQLDRNSDWLALGGRCPCEAEWTVSFNDSCKISSLKQQVMVDAGFDRCNERLHICKHLLYRLMEWPLLNPERHHCSTFEHHYAGARRI